ncbi:MAG TPA: hypothetical protein VFD82_14390 [Planctomycetota bacterium]|nr:hypothetical protein [Planctomycetota bacterium]
MPSLLSNALAALCLTTVALAQGPCPAVGVTVDASGGRLGDAWRVDIGASPTVLGVLGLDFAPGPIPTPIGTICLGLTPSLLTVAFLTDPAGTATFAGLLPPAPAFAGIDIYAAAITLDPAQPGGWGVSNGDSFRVREPRFWFVNPGSATPFGTTPGAIAATNAIADTVAFSQTLTTAVRDAATVPERGWLVLLLASGSLVAYDGVSPTPVLNTALTGAAASAFKILAVPGGDTLLLLTFGTPPSPFSPGSPGSVHNVSLPGGTVASVPLTAGNPNSMILIPGTTLVYLLVANGLIPFDHGSATLSPVVALPSGFGGVADLQTAAGLLYVLHGGQAAGPFSGSQPAAITVVDPLAQTLLLTQQLTMPVPATMLRAGLGSAGPALYAYGATAAALHEFAQGSVGVVGTVPVGTGITHMELSSLGTMWLLYCSGPSCGGPALLGMLVGTTVVVPLAALGAQPQPAFAVSPSAGYGKVCLVLGNSLASPFQTEPFAPGTAVVLPIVSFGFRILSD